MIIDKINKKMKNNNYILFLHQPDVPPTNNRAERLDRIVKRKVKQNGFFEVMKIYRHTIALSRRNIHVIRVCVLIIQCI
jgi:hypothetical protein